jgi:hypothetical protein
MLCINQGNVHERSDQVSFMKGIYEIAESVTVWLGTNEKLAQALFTDENAELLVFKDALEFWGWENDEYQIHKLVDRFREGLSENPHQAQGRTTTFILTDDNHATFSWSSSQETDVKFSWSGKLPKRPLDSFYRSLSKYGARIDRLGGTAHLPTDHGRREENPSAEVSTMTRNFLTWLHFVHLHTDMEREQAQTELTDAFAAYMRRIYDQRSDVWHVAEHAVTCVLQSRNKCSMLQSFHERTKSILENPWFSRTWVVQEASSNTCVQIVVGMQETDWDTLICLSKFLWSAVRSLLTFPDIRNLREEGYAYQAITDRLLVAKVNLWMRFQKPGSEFAILDILNCTQGLSVTDPRDKIFGVYQLATDLPNLSFRPDYTKTTAEIWATFTRCIIAATRSLKVLAGSVKPLVQDSNLEFPSWIRKSSLGAINDFSTSEYQAAGNYQSVLLDITSQTTLVLQGFTITMVKEVIDTKSSIDFWANFRENHQRSWNEFKSIHHETGDEVDNSERDPKSKAKIPMPLLWGFLQFAHHSIFASGSSSPLYIEDAVQPEFCFESFFDMLKPLDIDLDSYFPMIAKAWELSDPNFALLNHDLGYQQEMRKLAHTVHGLKEAWILENLLISARLTDKHLFFSINGKLGTCPKGTRAGDLIVGLFGGNVPFVLRRKEANPSMPLAEILQQDPKYEMMGPCYLDGAMQGERMEHHTWSDILHADPLDPDLYGDPSGEHFIKGVYQKQFFHIE